MVDNVSSSNIGTSFGGMGITSDPKIDAPAFGKKPATLAPAGAIGLGDGSTLNVTLVADEPVQSSGTGNVLTTPPRLDPVDIDAFLEMSPEEMLDALSDFLDVPVTSQINGALMLAFLQMTETVAQLLQSFRVLSYTQAVQSYDKMMEQADSLVTGAIVGLCLSVVSSAAVLTMSGVTFRNSGKIASLEKDIAKDLGGSDKTTMMQKYSGYAADVERQVAMNGGNPLSSAQKSSLQAQHGFTPKDISKMENVVRSDQRIRNLARVRDILGNLTLPLGQILPQFGQFGNSWFDAEAKKEAAAGSLRKTESDNTMSSLGSMSALMNRIFTGLSTILTSLRDANKKALGA